MSFPKIGNKAPSFTLNNQDGNKVKLTDLAGQVVVLYFYPKAMTPGCTVQACGIRDSRTALQKLGVVVLGLSPDPVSKLAKFREKESLNFDLLSDEDHRVADKYGVWGLKKFMGREYVGIRRTTFIIDRDSRLQAVFDKVKTKSHHEELVAYIAENL